MKKIILSFVMILSLFCTSCGSKEAPANITLIDENQEETNYQIHKTDHLDEVKEIFKNLHSAKLDMEFNGVAIDFKTGLEGKIIVTNQEVRTIDLGYTLEIDAITNLKKYRMNGSVLLTGFTNTDSASLSFKTKNKLLLEFTNDDEYAYLKGSLEEENNRLSIKDKVNIEAFTNQYKALISSYIDLMKYYNPLDILPEYNELIDTYHITICKTTRDSFTLRLHVPANLIFKEIDTDLTLDVDVEISCTNLLPIYIEFQADNIISIILENEYVEKYLSSMVEVEKAKLKVVAKLKYDHYTISELDENEKAAYKEYFIN